LQQQPDVIEARLVVRRVGGHGVLQLFERGFDVARGQGILRGCFLHLGFGLRLIGRGYMFV